jgi:drug/metabolite transporter (DMT)-like permease
MAITAQKNGLSVVSVASKMSVIIPILVGVILYNEQLSYLQIIGILLALLSVYLSSVKKGEKAKKSKAIVFPFLVFLGSGIIDSSIKYFEKFYLNEDLIALFSSTIFFFAAIFGLLWILGIKKQNLRAFSLRNLSAGVILGVVNYYSIYFLIRALKLDWLNSATIFTINNVAIVAVSCIVGYLMFKEPISRLNLTGIILALLSIYLISFSL